MEEFNNSIVIESRTDIFAVSKERDISVNNGNRKCIYIEVKYSKSSSGRDLLKELHKLVILRDNLLLEGIEIGLIVIGDNLRSDEVLYMRRNDIVYVRYMINDNKLDGIGDIDLWVEQ